jgi:hypothetical protein
MFSYGYVIASIARIVVFSNSFMADAVRAQLLAGKPDKMQLPGKTYLTPLEITKSAIQIKALSSSDNNVSTTDLPIAVEIAPVDYPRSSPS